MAGQDAALGKAFAEALARKDFADVAALLDSEIDFRGLTSGRSWEASGADAVLETMLGHWFEDSDEIEQVVSLDTDALPIASVSPIASTSATRMESLWSSNRRTTPSETDKSHGCACSAPDYGRAEPRTTSDLATQAIRIVVEARTVRLRSETLHHSRPHCCI